MGSRLTLINTYLVDYFTLGHIALWAVFGWWALRSKEAGLGTTLLCGLVIGLSWEVLEMYVEILIGFREPFWNRFFFDPLADFLGAGLGWAIARNVKFTSRT